MYIYEMHQHTAACSRCGKADTKELIKALKEHGFSGVVITNHFYNGNTGIDRNLPFEEFCEAYENDYLVAKKEGERLGIDVLFGIEQGVGNGKEILVYGLTPEKLKKHPEITDGKLKTLSQAVHSEGGMVFQAHPFRNREYINFPDEKLPLELLDGIESLNRQNTDEDNIKALTYAKEHGLKQVAGSDSHSEDFSVRRFGIECSCRIKTEEELVSVLKSDDYKLHIEVYE